jgi:hypothetical protein
VQDLLLGKQPKVSPPIQLVVIHGEVGYEHAKTVAGYSDGDMTVLKQWDPEKFVESLLDLEEECMDPGGSRGCPGCS